MKPKRTKPKKPLFGKDNEMLRTLKALGYPHGKLRKIQKMMSSK